MLVAEDGGVEGRFLVAFFLLLDIVEQGDARVLGEADDSVEVGQAQEAHEEVGEVPDEGELSQAAEEDHDHDTCAEDEQVFHDVTTCISWIYERFKYGNKRFPGFFSLHSFGFMKEGKDDGKKRMMRTWEHILNGLCEVLKNDPKIRPGVFDENFTEMQFAEILFSLMLVSVIREDYDPSSVLMLINKTLY